MAVHAGLFNKRIYLQYETGESYDSDGYPIEGEKVNVPVWAMVKTVSAKEYYQAKALESESVVRFVIRYRRDVKYDMRVIYDGRTFEIESIINDNEQNVTLTILAREVSKIG